MVDGFNLYCKNKIDEEKIIKTLSVNESEILFINDVDGWLNKKDEKIVIEHKGILDKEDDYPEYHYYTVSLFENNIKDKFKRLQSNNIILDFE